MASGNNRTHSARRPLGGAGIEIAPLGPDKSGLSVKRIDLLNDASAV